MSPDAVFRWSRYPNLYARLRRWEIRQRNPSLDTTKEFCDPLVKVGRRPLDMVWKAEKRNGTSKAYHHQLLHYVYGWSDGGVPHRWEILRPGLNCYFGDKIVGMENKLCRLLSTSHRHAWLRYQFLGTTTSVSHRKNKDERNKQRGGDGYWWPLRDGTTELGHFGELHYIRILIPSLSYIPLMIPESSQRWVRHHQCRRCRSQTG